MKLFLSTLLCNVIDCFRGRMIIWHITAIFLTFVVVMSGFDWRYFLSTRNLTLRSWMLPAVHIGGLLPIVLPLALLALGAVGKSFQIRLVGWALAQAELVGGLVAAGYKALTGRAHPSHQVASDLTHIFRFGILRGGVFWGWPSSHTTIAFAMAVAIYMLLPKQRWVGWIVIAYALYVGVGVSTTIHWFSDFVAGAIIGSAIGAVVGKAFLRIQRSTRAELSDELPKRH